MATPIRWTQRGRVAPYGDPKRTDTPLRSLALSLTHVARAALSEPYMLTIEHKRIQLNRLPKAFGGFRLVQLSDVHHGPFSDREQIERAVETANRLRVVDSPQCRAVFSFRQSSRDGERTRRDWH